MRSTNGKKFSPGKPTPPISRRRLWWFRFCAAILFPLVIIGGLELGLRLFGYGYPTDFFLRYDIKGQGYYVPNDEFGCRFFPPAITRAPMPQRMAVKKSPDTYRIFVFGESAAMGDPDPSYGMGRYLQVLLQERYPEIHFEVICVAMTAIDSDVVLPIARECARRDGDLWVIYMGNNEMVGPFGAIKMVPFTSDFTGGNKAPRPFDAETAYGLQAPPLGVIRTVIAVKATRLGQLLDNVIRRLRSNSSTPTTWGGMQMFMNGRIGYDDPARLRAYANFKGNLEDILRMAHGAGVPVVLSTVAVNLKECAPFASIHKPGLSTNQLSAWNELFEEGITNETAGFYGDALVWYGKAAEIDPQFAELQFRMGDCNLALTNSVQALPDFQLARDYDALDFRADSRINSAIRDEAARHGSDGVHLVEADKILAQNSPDGIPGLNFFYEHVHLNFAGNYLLALNFAGQIKGLLPNPLSARDKGSWASEELCERRLAVTVWDRQRVWQSIMNRVVSPPFTGQYNHAANLKNCEAKVDEVKSMMNTQTDGQARQMYEQALAWAPTDGSLYFNFAQYLGAKGAIAQATEEAKHVCELLPQAPGEFSDVGNLLILQAKIDEAAEYYARALALRNNYVPALNGLGQILENQQKASEALACYRRALRADPDDVATHINIGFLEQNRGNLGQGAVHYQRAAELQPQGPADYFNQGVAAAALGQMTGAIESFGMAVESKPEFWQAHYLLGLELAGEGKIGDAEKEFWNAIIYRPDFARSHLNLGIMLMKQQRLDPALTQFQITLQLDPANQLAGQLLGEIQASKNHGLPVAQ
jgi:tetratricopeptide (TPR) repeat protein